MARTIRVSVVQATDVDESLASDITRLIRDMSATAELPTTEELRAIVAASATSLLIAREAEGHQILGTLTLATFRIPTGTRAWIEDVVVDPEARGQGIGEQLTREAIRLAVDAGARTIELTSRPSREAANRLYRRIGFQKRETNVYRFTPTE